MTSKLQPLDQGRIRTFKTYYRKQVEKYIIACSATAQMPDDIKIAPFIGSMPHGNAISEHTIRNTLNVAGFKDEIHEHIPTAALNSLSATSIETTIAIINET